MNIHRSLVPMRACYTDLWAQVQSAFRFSIEAPILCYLEGKGEPKQS